jgi:hypothetical protein
VKKVLTIILILAVAAVAGVFLFNRFFPNLEIPFLSEDYSPVKSLVCAYPVRVSGDSMEPLFKSGALVSFDKCISEVKGDLAAGTVIMFQQGGPLRLAVIREKRQDGRGIYYKASPEARPLDLSDVLPDEISAVYRP